MSDVQAIADRIEIEALRGEFADAVMMRDDDRVASLFTQDGAVRIPDINAEAVSREQARAGVERLHAASLRNGRWRGNRGARARDRIARCRWVAVRWRHEAPRRSRAGFVSALRDHRSVRRRHGRRRMQLFRGLLVSPSRPEHLPLGVPGRASVPIKHCFRVELACAPAGSPAIQLVAADLKPP